MAGFTARQVQALRQATGVGMLDAKRALEACEGDVEGATRWLREKGLSDRAKRLDRVATQGAVAVATSGSAAAMVELRCETDFVAKAAEFVALADALAQSVAAGGPEAVAEHQEEVDRLSTILKENISVGRVERLEAPAGAVVETYLHRQAGRGVNGVVVVLEGGSAELAHDVAVHIAFARPEYLRREDVPEQDVAAERATVEAMSRNEGKPEAALPKIVEGRMTGWFKERCLLEQPYAKDEKKSVGEILGGAQIVRFVQVVVGS